jgi:hypothetical protein
MVYRPRLSGSDQKPGKLVGAIIWALFRYSVGLTTSFSFYSLDNPVCTALWRAQDFNSIYKLSHGMLQQDVQK